MLKKILVLADGGDPSQPALGRALQCIDDSGEVEIFDAVYEPMLEGYMGNKEIYEPLRKRVLGERRERAEGLARTVESSGVRGTATAVWDHPLDRAVAKEVGAKHVDLVVVAPTQGGGLSHREWQLVVGCLVPVLVVKSDGRLKYRSIVAAVDPFHAHAKPAALDVDILRNAQVMQAATGAALTVLHCYTPLTYFGADLARPAAQDPRFEDGRQEALHELCAAAGIPESAARLVAGPPHEVLHGMQKRGEADLVVMGGLARGRLAELLVGNTAERLLHAGRADVLVIKPTGAARAPL